MVKLQSFIAAPTEVQATSILTTMEGISIGLGVAGSVGLVLCAIRRYRRREAGRKGLYTFGAANAADEDEALDGDDPVDTL